MKINEMFFRIFKHCEFVQSKCNELRRTLSRSMISKTKVLLLQLQLPRLFSMSQLMYQKSTLLKSFKKIIKV